MKRVRGLTRHMRNRLAMAEAVKIYRLECDLKLPYARRALLEERIRDAKHRYEVLISGGAL